MWWSGCLRMLWMVTLILLALYSWFDWFRYYMFGDMVVPCAIRVMTLLISVRCVCCHSFSFCILFWSRSARSCVSILSSVIFDSENFRKRLLGVVRKTQPSTWTALFLVYPVDLMVSFFSTSHVSCRFFVVWCFYVLCFICSFGH